MVMECSWLSGQDAHERLQVAEWLTASLYQCSREVSDMSWLHNLYIVQALKKKRLSHLYCCLQEKGAHKQWYRAWKKRGKKALPNVEDRTLTVRPPRSKDRLFSTLIVYIAPTWHHWSRLPHNKKCAPKHGDCLLSSQLAPLSHTCWWTKVSFLG